MFTILSYDIFKAGDYGTGLMFGARGVGTKPWLILIFFFVGVIAGISNVIRSAKNMQK